MAQSVKIADKDMAILREEASLQNRSIAGQLTHWMTIGRQIERSDAFNYENIRAALKAALSPDELTPEEQIVWFDALDSKIAAPGEDPQITAAFKALGEQVGAVGYDDDGKLIVVSDNAN